MTNIHFNPLDFDTKIYNVLKQRKENSNSSEYKYIFQNLLDKNNFEVNKFNDKSYKKLSHQEIIQYLSECAPSEEKTEALDILKARLKIHWYNGFIGKILKKIEHLVTYIFKFENSALAKKIDLIKKDDDIISATHTSNKPADDSSTSDHESEITNNQGLGIAPVTTKSTNFPKTNLPPLSSLKPKPTFSLSQKNYVTKIPQPSKLNFSYEEIQKVYEKLFSEKFDPTNATDLQYCVRTLIENCLHKLNKAENVNETLEENDPHVLFDEAWKIVHEYYPSKQELILNALLNLANQKNNHECIFNKYLQEMDVPQDSDMKEKQSYLSLVIRALAVGTLILGGAAAFYKYSQPTPNQSLASAEEPNTTQIYKPLPIAFEISSELQTCLPQNTSLIPQVEKSANFTDEASHLLSSLDIKMEEYLCNSTTETSHLQPSNYTIDVEEILSEDFLVTNSSIPLLYNHSSLEPISTDSQKTVPFEEISLNLSSTNILALPKQTESSFITEKLPAIQQQIEKIDTQELLNGSFSNSNIENTNHQNSIQTACEIAKKTFSYPGNFFSSAFDYTSWAGKKTHQLLTSNSKALSKETYQSLKAKAMFINGCAVTLLLARGVFEFVLRM